MKEKDWHSVPERHWNAWRNVFNSSKEILDLSEACPVCKKKTLHRWFLNETNKEGITSDGYKFVGQGGAWEWCHSCKSFLHLSSLIPDWWDCDLEVDTNKLTSYPTEIEEAMKKRKA